MTNAAQAMEDVLKPVQTPRVPLTALAGLASHSVLMERRAQVCLHKHSSVTLPQSLKI